MYQLGQQLRKMSDKEGMDGRNILCEFLLQSKRFQTMPADVVWRMLHFAPPLPMFYVKSNLHLYQAKNSQTKERLINAWKPIHQHPEAYLHARNGDHTLVPFECDTCIFRKLTSRDPIIDNPTDTLLLA